MYDTKKPIYLEEFDEMVSGTNFVKRVLENNFVVAQYPHFKESFVQAYEEIKEDSQYHGGALANYIPSLKKVDPNLWASAFCSADSQFTQVGDHHYMFSMQSLSKVVSYAYLHSIFMSQGRGDDLHKWIG